MRAPGSDSSSDGTTGAWCEGVVVGYPYGGATQGCRRRAAGALTGAQPSDAAQGRKAGPAAEHLAHERPANRAATVPRPVEVAEPIRNIS